MKKFLLFFLAAFSGTAPVHAQPFTDLHNQFPTMTNASARWADYDNDGDPDLALIGFSSATAEVSSVYRNDGNGVFTLAANLNVLVSSGAASWGDYDHDGDSDLLVNGQTGTGPPAATTLYRNDGSSVFTVVPASLPGIIGIGRWMDYDGDGWLDVILIGSGVSLNGDSTRLFRNDTNGTFTEVPVTVPGYMPSDFSVVDFDNDGDMDFFLTGGTLSVSTFPVTRLFRNDGNAVFTRIAFNLQDLSTGTSAWADYDNDGDKDLLYDGIDSTFGNGITLLYRNDSAGNFTLIPANLPGSGEPGSVDWADLDNDGDLDILLGGPTALLRNDGSNVFTDITPVTFLVSVPCSFADIDNDGDQDVLLISQSGGNAASTIHRNELFTGIHEAGRGEDFPVYPNPASGILTIHPNETLIGAGEVTIMNTLGEKVLCLPRQNLSAEISIDVSLLKPAVYFYFITHKGRMISSGKICIE